MYSIDTISVSEDEDSPSYITGCVMEGSEGFTLIDATEGIVRNDSGRTLALPTGAVSFQANNGTGGAAILEIWSERSSDDFATFSENARSQRNLPISNSTSTSATKDSHALAWADGESIRFACYNSSGGTLNLEAPSDTVNGGNAISGESFSWEISEK